MASTRGPPRGVVGPELWPVGGIGSPIRPYHFLPPRGLLSSVMSGGHIILHQKMKRYWPILRAIWLVFSLLRRGPAAR